MKSVLQRSVLLLAALSTGQLQAAEENGGIGCLPGGFANPQIPLGSAASLVIREVIGPVDPEPPIGANCNSVRVTAALPGWLPGLEIESPFLQNTFAWTLEPAESMRSRTLYIRPKPGALSSNEPLQMEIYRQSLQPLDTARSGEPSELQVLLVRGQPLNDPFGEPQPAPTEVWVIVHDTRRQLLFFRTPISQRAVTSRGGCRRNGQSFGACVSISADDNLMYISLLGANGEDDFQSMTLPAARVQQILLGNVYTSAGRSTDQFNLAHSAESFEP